MSKITKIPSEIRNFFSEKRRSAVMDTFTRLLENINLDCRSLGGMKRPNCRLTNLQVFQILVERTIRPLCRGKLLADEG